MLRAWFRLACLLLCLAGLASAQAPVDPAQQDEETLKQEKLATDDAALLQFFRDRTLSDARRAKILAMLTRLGDDDFDVREQATKDLLAEGSAANGLLRQAIAARDTDVEIVRRAERILETQKAPGSHVSAAAARLLGKKKPPGSAAALLAYQPFAEDESVVEALRAAVIAVALRDGQPDPAITAALEDKLPARRGLAAEALIRGGSPEQRAHLRKFLTDAEAEVRLRAGLAFVEKKEKDAVPVLIALLADLPQDQSWEAEEMLCRLAGEDMPKTALGSDAASRKKCSEAWQQWWMKNEPTLDLARLDQAQPVLGYTLLVLIDPNTGIGKITELDRENKARWQIPNLQYPVDAQVVRNDRVLIAEYNNGRVTERNFKGEILWQQQVQSPINVQRLPNGHTFIACHNQLLVVDHAGKEQFRHDRPNHDIMTAVRLRDGQFFFVTNGGLGTRLDARGNVAKTFPAGQVHQFGGLDVLPNGRLLIPQVSGGKIVEVDADGKTVWNAALTQPTAAVRLANGNTLAASFNQQKVVELDPTGKQLSEFRPDGRPWKVRRR
ncbi:MAG: PQQ-binding-like beta-propeller repeat protein [Planctomycetia bacterium]|nr:PQQ-binding-like beta-propeller repeat protein [Planctomycetia bacterium]